MFELNDVTHEIQSIIDELSFAQRQELFSQISGGKMVRPKLMLKISSHPDTPKLAAIVELIHTASLLHDDVIDESALRRKKPTLNALFGDKTAVMFGDILYSAAFTKLANFDKKIAQTISSSVTTLSIGELEDVALGADINKDEQRYLDMLYKKTGALIEAAAVGAAQLAGIEESGIKIYARNLGVAFQIIDDVLDIVSNEEQLGKKPFSDFKEGKTTIPYIHLFQHAPEHITKQIASLYRKTYSEDDISFILAQMHAFGSIDYALSCAKKLTQSGIDALNASAIEQRIKTELEEIAKKQLSRLF